jgi:succinate dehydrogenase / fumarate reductase flavoprotein subunit
LFKNVETIQHDIAVIGAGLAGMSAAVAAHDLGAKVALITKVHPVRSHSGAAQGGINAAVKADDDWHDHMFDTVKGAGYLADQDAVRIMCSEAPNSIRRLDNWGALFSRNDDGTISQRPFGGQRRNRTCFAADKTGHNLLHTLYSQVLKREIPVHEELYVLRLVVQDGRCVGLVAYDLPHGRLIAIEARAVIIATGGAARVFGQSSNALINTGDGLLLAFNAGAEIEDMEFFQTHPTGLPNGILMTEGCRGEGAYLINREGERFMQRYAPKFMELAPRDQVSRAIETELLERRGFEDGCVRLDMRHLGEQRIQEKLPQIREIALYFAGVDPVTAPIPVRPTVHYTMGGVNVGTDCRTRVEGLYACGEAACVSVHGANRLGGNSLLETVVFGPVAGASAVEDLPQLKSAPVPKQDMEAEEKRLAEMTSRNEGERPVEVRQEMEKVMRETFRVFKKHDDMENGLGMLRSLRERGRQVALQDEGTVFNMDLVHALQLQSMLDVALMSAETSLLRKESRGGHFRRDFPKMDNRNFLHHSIVRRSADGEMEFDKLPVTIEDIQPEAEVKY